MTKKKCRLDADIVPIFAPFFFSIQQVNKTVTEKEGGGYITKYRGEHLEDCIRLKKAQLAAQAAQAAAQNGHHSIQKEQ